MIANYHCHTPRCGHAVGSEREYIEQAHSQANSMITALSSDYRSVYYVDLDKDEGICYRAHSNSLPGA